MNHTLLDRKCLKKIKSRAQPCSPMMKGAKLYRDFCCLTILKFWRDVIRQIILVEKFYQWLSLQIYCRIIVIESYFTSLLTFLSHLIVFTAKFLVFRVYKHNFRKFYQSMATFYVRDNHKDEIINEMLPPFKKLKGEDHKVRVPLHCITNGNDNEFGPNPVCTSHKDDNKEFVSNDSSNRNFDIECVPLLENSAKLSIPEEPTIPTAEDCVILKDYGKDILEHFFNQEKSVLWPDPNYMRKQQYLTNDMRSILIQWLIDVSIEYGLVEETVFLAVHYIDCFLSVMSVVRDKFQLLGAAAIMISVKVEDVIKIPPEDWSMLTANAYTTRQIIRMEQLIMNVLKFDLRPPTVICFIRHICARYHFTKDTLLFSTYVAELTLLDGNKYIEYLPSKLAVSAIVLVRHVLNESEPYFENLQFCCGYSCEEIKPVMIEMYCTICEACGGKFQSIERKYGDKVSEFVATINRNNMNFFG